MPSDLPPDRPPYDIAPPGDTMGVRHVELALRDLDFPMTLDEVRARAGHWRIPVTGDTFVELGEYLDGVPRRRRFRNAGQVADAIGKAHPEWRE